MDYIGKYCRLVGSSIDFRLNVPPTVKDHMEMEPQFIVTSERLENPVIKTAPPGLQGEWHNHCITDAAN